jgi:hypothetical protein
MTLSLLLFLLFAGGIIVGWLLHSYWGCRRKPSKPQSMVRLRLLGLLLCTPEHRATARTTSRRRGV